MAEEKQNITTHHDAARTDSETACWWDNKRYGVGSIVKQDDGKCHRCNEKGEWDPGKDCGA